MNIEALRQQLCQSFCREIGFLPYENGVVISLPIYDRDGDGFSIYVTENSSGWELSDSASTFMRLSYEHDVETLLKGSKKELFDSYVLESKAIFDDGEFILKVPADQLMTGIFTFTQLLNRVSDIALLRSYRSSSTFFDDLRDALYKIVPGSIIHSDYIVPNIPNAEDYKVQYMIDAQRPLFLFGATNKETVKLITITLQYLEKHSPPFDSMVILEDFSKVPQADFRRLLIAANEIIPNITDQEALSKKINHRLAIA